jgi:hypothetical protein
MPEHVTNNASDRETRTGSQRRIYIFAIAFIAAITAAIGTAFHLVRRNWFIPILAM